MMKHIIIRLALLSIALLLASCATQNTTARNGSQQAKTAKAGDVASTTVDDPVQADDPVQVDDTLTAELPPLSYVWNTNFGAHLTAPSEIRDAATIACEARGFDVAIMAGLSLNGSEAKADFTCQGQGE
jgi:predicted small secreted protein